MYVCNRNELFVFFRTLRTHIPRSPQVVTMAGGQAGCTPGPEVAHGPPGPACAALARLSSLPSQDSVLLSGVGSDPS